MAKDPLMDAVKIEASHPVRRKRSRLATIWREVRPIILVILVLSVFRSAAADWYSVPTGSMKPSILEGERILVNKAAFDLHVPFTSWRLMQCGEPARGDVVVFDSPKDGTRLVKRVVGIPGDIVEMRDNRLTVNGKALGYDARLPSATEVYVDSSELRRELATERLGLHPHPIMLTPQRPSLRSFAEVRVPDGHFYMMGDNRDESADSRYFGFVSRERISGRAVAVITSCDPDRYYLPRWSRFFTSLP